MPPSTPPRRPRSARLLAAAALVLLAAGPAGAEPRPSIAMHGEPALAPGFERLPYASPEARPGGRITFGQLGSFDSLNPFVTTGVAPDALPRYVVQGMMLRSADEPFALYGLLARTIDVPEDRSSVAFALDERARFSDGRPVTSADVLFSFDLLKRKGRPFYRSSFGRVTRAEADGPLGVRFALGEGADRELPLILATMPIFPAHATDEAGFERGSLKPLIGSGPYVVADVRPGERVLLRRDPNWWARDLPLTRGLYNADEVAVEFYRDANTLFEALKSGLVEVRTEDNPQRWAAGYDFPAAREGRVLRDPLLSRAPKGLTAFVLNGRRKPFDDPRVREAFGVLFDFEWVNRNLFAGAYRRTGSAFEGSELSARGRPASAGERALLAPFPGAVREDVLEGRWGPPASDGSGRDRSLARRALALLGEAGLAVRDGALRGPDGREVAPEVLVVSRAQERLALTYARELAAVGVRANVRLVDDAQYWRRLRDFDFDVTQFTYAGSPSPGGEQATRWGSAAADRPGSLNYAGVRSPAADAMIAALTAARTREAFTDAARALDRVLISGFHVVPLFHAAEAWVARAAAVRRPDPPPLIGYAPETWWKAAP